MDEPQKHHVKRKKWITEDHLLYDTIYVKYAENKSVETESRLIIAWA